MKPDKTNSNPVTQKSQNVNTVPDETEPSTAVAQAPTQQGSPAQPAFSTNPHPFTPQPKKSNKGLIIGSIVAAVVAIGLVGGGIGAYAWYQNPEKVLDDAMANALTEKQGTYDAKLDIAGSGSSATSLNMNYQVTGDGNKTAVTYDASADVSGTKVKLNGGVYYEVGGAYLVKVNGINKLLNDYMEAQGISRSEMPSSILDIINKIDNKWISISDADLKDLSKDDSFVKVKQCTDKIAINTQKDMSYKQEIATLYQKNRLILIDKSLGSRDGAVGFELKGDESKQKEFVKGLKDTKLLKEYRDCLPSDQRSNFDGIFDETSSQSATSSSNEKVEIWIDQWSHKIRSFKMTGDSSGSKVSFEMTAKPFDASKLVKPNEDTTASQLKNDVEQLMESYQSSMNGYSSPTSSFDSF